MTKPNIIDEHEIPMFEVKKEFAKIKKREQEPNFRVQKTEEHINTFVSIDPKKGKELVEKLQGLQIPRLHDKQIFKIVDILPRTVDELKVVMQGYTLTINNDNMKKIVKVVQEFLPEE